MKPGTILLAASIVAAVGLSAGAATEEDIGQRLRTSVQGGFQDVPLHEALKQIGHAAGAEIRLDHAELKKLGLRPDLPVTIHLPQIVSAKSLLELILEPHGLRCVFEGDHLEVVDRHPCYAETIEAHDLAWSAEDAQTFVVLVRGAFDRDRDRDLTANPSGSLVLRPSAYRIDSVWLSEDRRSIVVTGSPKACKEVRSLLELIKRGQQGQKQAER